MPPAPSAASCGRKTRAVDTLGRETVFEYDSAGNMIKEQTGGRIFIYDYDFAGKQMPNLSKILLDINPRYSYKGFNIWLSARYSSKRYANVGNSIVFDGRWETFAGASYKINKHATITANVVNFLNTTGPAGNVPGSALITDGSQFAGSLIAGTYIRPFQMEFGLNINF